MADTLSVRQKRQEADVVFSSTNFDRTREVSGYLLDYEGNIGVAVSGGSPANTGGNAHAHSSQMSFSSTAVFRSSTGSTRSQHSSTAGSGGGGGGASSSGVQKYAEFFAQRADVDARLISATHSYTGTLLKDPESGTWVPHGRGRLVYRVWTKAKNTQKASVNSPKENAPLQTKVDTLSPSKRQSDSFEGVSGTSSDPTKPQDTVTIFECVFEGKFVFGQRQGSGMLVIPTQYALFCQWKNDSPNIETKPCVLLFLSSNPTETSMPMTTIGKGNNANPITVSFPMSGTGATRMRFGSRAHSEGADVRERSPSSADPPRSAENASEDRLYIADQYVGMVSLITGGMTTRADFDGLAWVSQVQILPDCTGEMLFHIDKKRYCGGWQCGQRHGFGVELDPKTDTVFMGAFQYDVRDGPGTLYSDNFGTVFSGVWKDGELSDTANLYLPNNVATIQGAHWKSYDSLEFENGAVLRTRGTLNGIWEPMFVDFDNILAVSALETRDVDDMSYGDLVSNMLQKPQLMSVLAQFQRCFYFQYSLCPVRGKSVHMKRRKLRDTGDAEERSAHRANQSKNDRDTQKSQAIPLSGTPLHESSRSRHSRPAFLSAPEPSMANGSLGSDPCIHGTSTSSRSHVRSADEHGLIATPTIRSRAPPPTQQSSTPKSNHNHQLLPLALWREQAKQQKRRQNGRYSDGRTRKGTGAASGARVSSDDRCGMGSDWSDSSEDDCSDSESDTCDALRSPTRSLGYRSADGRLRPQASTTPSPSQTSNCVFEALLRSLANQGNATVCQRREWISPSWCEEMGLGMHCFHSQLSAWRPTLCLKPPPGVQHLLLRRERNTTHSTFSSAMHCLASFVASVRLRLLSFVAAHPAACDLSVSKDVLRVCWDCLYALVSPVLFDLSKTLEPFQESEFALAVRRLRSVTLRDFLADVPQYLELTPNGWYRATNTAEKRNFGKRQYTTQRVMRVLAERWAQVFSSILSCPDLERTVENTAWGPLVLLHTRTKCESPMDAVRVLLATYQVAMCISPSNALMRERVFTYCAVAAFQHVENEATARGSRSGSSSRYRMYDPVSAYAPVALLRILDLLARDVTPGYPFDVVNSFHDDSFEKDIISSIAAAPDESDAHPHSPANSKNDGEEEDWRSGGDMDEDLEENDEQRWISPGGKRRPVSLRSNSTDSSRNDVAVSNLVQMALEGVRRASKLFPNIRDVYTGTLYPLDEISLRVQFVFLEAFHTSDVEADFIVASPDAIASLAVPTRMYVHGDIPGCTPAPSPYSTPNIRAVADTSAESNAVQYLLNIADVLQPCDVMLASLQRRSGDNVENAVTARIIWVIASIGEVFTMPEEFSTSAPQNGQSCAAAAAIVAASSATSPPSPRGTSSHNKSSPRYRSGGTAVTAHANRMEKENDCDFEFQWKHFVYLAQPIRRAAVDAIPPSTAGQGQSNAAPGSSGSNGATREFPSTTTTATIPNPVSPREQMQFVLLKALLMRLGVSVCLQARYCNAEEDESMDDDEDTTESVCEAEIPRAAAEAAVSGPTGATIAQGDAEKTPQWKSLWVSSSDSSDSGDEQRGANDARKQTHKAAQPRKRKTTRSRGGQREEYNGMETTLVLRCRKSFLRSAVREELASEWGSCRRALQLTIQMNSQRLGTRKTR